MAPARVLARLLLFLCMARWARAIGVNWGTQASHPLPASTVVRMLRDNGFTQVKLFDAEDGILSALRGSGIQVMVGIPNDMLADLAAGTKAAENWVSKNVSKYVNDGVDIRYVAVGNEPFLGTYNGTYLKMTYPAMQNIQAALVKAGLSQIKVTVPLNADVYDSLSGKPSDGDFRDNIRDVMMTIVQFLNSNGAPFITNIYPFISLYNDPNFPLDYAFFQGTGSPVVDGSITYQNTFDANHDTLVSALRKNGFSNVSIVIGEIGWPTDGDMNANLQNAKQFNQGFMTHISSGQGTPLRPGPVDAYLFSLIDEDQKSIQPGNFERHWGVFNYDGTAKYPLSLQGAPNGSTLVPAKGVKYLDKKWCVFKPSANLNDQKVGDSVSYACGKADCTSLGYKTSCGTLDVKGNISYAFNSYYQTNDQDDRACDFSGLATVTTVNPSTDTCKFIIEIAVGGGAVSWTPRIAGAVVAVVAFLLAMF